MAQQGGFEFRESDIRDITPFPVGLYFKLRVFLIIDNQDKNQWDEAKKEAHNKLKKEIFSMFNGNEDFKLLDDISKIFRIVPTEEP